YRFHPFRFEFAEVGERHFPAEAVAGFEERVSDRPAVERGRAFGGKQPVGSGELWVPEDLAYRGRLAVPGEDRLAIAVGEQAIERVFFIGPRSGNNFGQREAMVGVIDRGCEQVLPGKLAELLVKLRPTIDAAGHGDGLNILLRHLLRVAET